jgi:hypothetical protein
VIPPDANAGFVAAMEDVLETYQKPRDPDRPLVCLDETSKQMIVETRAPIPTRPGRAARHDYEYERNGVANLFMMFAPLEGWRRVKVTDRHAAADYAQVLKELSDVHFPDAEKISARIRRLRSTRPSPPPKRAASQSGSNGTTPLNTEAGSTWPNPNSASCRASVSAAEFQTRQAYRDRSPLGRTIVTSITQRPTGNSQQPTPA